MRRVLNMLPVVAALAAASALAAMGCEDGPTQTYQASPPGAGSVWTGDGTNSHPVAADGGQGYDAGYPTISKTQLCSTDLKRQRWAWMLAQPVQPPRFYAGLDMAKDDLWSGLKIDDAEQPPSGAPDMPGGGLCQSQPLGYEGTCPSGFGGCNGNAWGNNNEVIFTWNVATHLVDQMELQLGYTGTMQTNMYPDHNGEMHSYTIAVGDVVRRDGQPFQIQWTDSTQRKIQITDIFNATMATFALKAGVPFDTSSCTSDTTCNAPGTSSICECAHVIDPTTNKPTAQCQAGSTGQCGIKNCGNDGNCLVYDDGSTTIFGIRPMVIYVQGNAGVPQPALSTPTLFYNFFSKWEPYSNLPQTVKLDKDGPFASGTPVGIPAGASVTCTQQIGQTFDDFVTNCVQVHGDKTNPNGVDAVNLNKVVHSLTHDQEHWTANVLGVNQNFTSLDVLNNPDKVVLDSDTPKSGDLAQDWTFDVRARGHVHNDYGGPAPSWPVPEFRGSALIMIEWARLLLADIAKITNNSVRTLGDPACIGYDSATGKPNYEIANNMNPGSCSGIEGMIIPDAAAVGGPHTDFTGDPKHPELDAGGNYDPYGIFASILKPGDLHGAFCVDAGLGDLDCTADGGVSIWQNALVHVRRVMGNGQLEDLPSELQDRRYYFKWFGVAYVKYLKAYGNYAAKYPTTVNSFPNKTVGSGLGPSDVMAQQIDLESLFFDYTVQPGAGGAQTFDKFEYIDRDFLGQGAGGAYNWIPFDFEYGCDLFGGNQRYDNWFRRMDREEIMLYSSMLRDKTHTAGQENNVNITNLFGSTLLGGDPNAGVAGVWPSYACAIGQAGDPNVNCVSGFLGGPANAPLDPTNPSGAAPCSGPCPAGQKCGGGNSFENGFVQACGDKCDFATYPKSGCKSPSQTCAGGACLDMKMDQNGTAGNGHACTAATAAKDCPEGEGCNATTGTCNPRPLLWSYPGAWSRTPFSRGHSPITLAPTDKHPNIGVAKVNVPNFVTDPKNPYTSGPYTVSPVAMPAGGCPMGYTASSNGAFCNAAVNSGTGYLAPSFSALTPWLEVQPQVGFNIPIDGQHNQFVSTGQFDFTGVLETYVVDYLPYVDGAKPSCVTDGVCNKGFTCDGASHNCYTDDNTIQIAAIEGADFLGDAFVCIDPWTNDILHVGMYDAVQPILDWFAAHPGGTYAGGVFPSAQTACNVIVIRSPYDNYVDFVVSKSNGVALNIGGGQGQGRVTDIVLFDPSLIKAL